MMPYTIFKIIHLTGIMMIFLSIGGLLAVNIAKIQSNSRISKIAGLTHGFALILVLISGIGLLAVLKLKLQMWIILKLFIWLFLGGITAILKRQEGVGLKLWWIVICVGSFAAFIALHKPF